MSERYCPKCKQNVPAESSCCNCFYEFTVDVDKVELEELVEVLEVMIAMNEGLAAKCGVQTNPDHVRGIAAKFRVKYLEGK